KQPDASARICHPERSRGAMPFKDHRYYVYIIASAARVLYIGFTSKLRERVWKHKTKTFEGFTSHFHFCRLVYFESFDDVRRAIGREKQIKRWRRDKKVKLIESVNPDWHDLSDDWYNDLEPKEWHIGSPKKASSG